MREGNQLKLLARGFDSLGDTVEFAKKNDKDPILRFRPVTTLV